VLSLVLQWSHEAGGVAQTSFWDVCGGTHCTATQGLCNTTLQFSASNNRITTLGYTYDAAGNVGARSTIGTPKVG
jgi:hypothetical protein